MFMFPMLSFIIFMFAGMFAFVGRAAGLGEEVTIVFALALPFEFSDVLQAAARTTKASKIKKHVILRISVLLYAIKKGRLLGTVRRRSNVIICQAASLFF